MSRPVRVSTDEIIKVARMHFLRSGHSASLKSIAQDLGLTHSAIIQRFGSKRELMITSLRPPKDYPWPAGFLEGPGDDADHALVQLRLTCEMLMRFLHEHMPQIVVLQSAGVRSSELFEDRLPLPLIACQRLKEWIERGVANGVFQSCDSASVASTIVGTMFSRSRLEALHDHYLSARKEMIGGEGIDKPSLLGSIEEVMNLFANFLINRESAPRDTDRSTMQSHCLSGLREL